MYCVADLRFYLDFNNNSLKVCRFALSALSANKLIERDLLVDNEVMSSRVGPSSVGRYGSEVSKNYEKNIYQYKTKNL